MTRLTLAILFVIALTVGCGEPSAPPPGADTGKMEAPAIDMPEVGKDPAKETEAPTDPEKEEK